MGMVGEACLPSNAYYPRTPDYTFYSGIHVCWSEHSDSSFVYGFMSLDYGLGTMTATTYYSNLKKTCVNSWLFRRNKCFCLTLLEPKEVKFQSFKFLIPANWEVASFSFQKKVLGRRGAYRTVVRPSSVSIFDQLYLHNLQADLSHFNM